MIIYNLVAAAILSAVLVGPIALVGVCILRRDQDSLNSWKTSIGLVEKVEPFSGETSFDILEIYHVYEGVEYKSVYDNNKNYKLARGDITAISVNPENPKKITIVRPGDARNLMYFFIFAYIMFVVAIFFDYTYGPHSN